MLTVEQVLSYAEPVAAGLLLLRLGSEGLLTRYRYFALFLACLLGEIVVVLAVPQETKWYFYAYVGVESFLWIVQIFVILELFSLVVRNYPAIAHSARTFINIAFGAAVALSLGFAVFQHSYDPSRFHILEGYLLVTRVVAFVLLAFFILLLGFLFWFPIPLSRNVIAYAIGFSVYFTGRALTRLAGNLFGPDHILLLSAVSLTLALACLLFWMLLLTRRGEGVDMTVGHLWQPERGEVLVRQLESLNATLLRTARK